jgi:hypothetical protein
VADVPDGSYFLFYANPASLVTYYVWYAYSNSTADPAPPGAIGIKVNIGISSPTANQIRDITRTIMNAYQFQAPDFRGMFPRFADPNGAWDSGASYRFSYTPGVGGPLPGSYEFQSFLSHNHSISYLGASQSSQGSAQWCVFNSPTMTAYSNYSGGTETRPVNTYLYPFIKY